MEAEAERVYENERRSLDDEAAFTRDSMLVLIKLYWIYHIICNDFNHLNLLGKKLEPWMCSLSIDFLTAVHINEAIAKKEKNTNYSFHNF